MWRVNLMHLFWRTVSIYTIVNTVLVLSLSNSFETTTVWQPRRGRRFVPRGSWTGRGVQWWEGTTDEFCSLPVFEEPIFWVGTVTPSLFFLLDFFIYPYCWRLLNTSGQLLFYSCVTYWFQCLFIADFRSTMTKRRLFYTKYLRSPQVTSKEKWRFQSYRSPFTRS